MVVPVPAHAIQGSSSSKPPDLRASGRVLIERLAGPPQFAALLDRQLGQCRRHGVRAAVLLILLLPRSPAAAMDAATAHALLQTIGARLSARVRGSDVVLQVGEHSFGLVLPSAGRLEAEAVRTRLAKALAERYGVAEQRLRVELRMGLAVYRENGSTGAELLQAAQEAQCQVEPARALSAIAV